MLELKHQGATFDTAWDTAMSLHPLRAKDIGGGGATASKRDARAAVKWYRRVCENAWFDEPAPNGGPSRLPLLQDLSVLLTPWDDSQVVGRSKVLKWVA